MSTISTRKMILVVVLIGSAIFALVILNEYRSYTTSVATGDVQGSLEFGGLQRTYLLHVPGSYDGSHPVAIVLVFHGGGGTGAEMARITHFSTVADQYGFTVAYPDGYMKTWNDGRNVSAAALAGVDDVGFVSKLIGVLSAQYNIDPNRVYATGLSNGGFFTGLLACQLANRVVAVAIVAATMDPRVSAACNPARALSIMMVQGDSDPLVPFNGGFVKGAL